MSLYSQLIQEINSYQNPQKAQIYQRFFKTKKGEYGEGDIFLGLNVPTQRQIAQKYITANFADLAKLLKSPIHEYRFVALVILTLQFKKNSLDQNPIFNFYLQNIQYINNWDLVDTSAPNIIGKFLVNKNRKDRKILYQFSHSDNLWQKRIAIISTLTFIKNHQLTDTINLSQILLSDPHDLIHKAVGWMLRELGKIDQKLLENFLMEHVRQMPRTMLRYAIEKLNPEKHTFYLKL